MFVETGGDLDIYKTAAGPTSCCTPQPSRSTEFRASLATPLPQTTIESLNEWAGMERILENKY